MTTLASAAPRPKDGQHTSIAIPRIGSLPLQAPAMIADLPSKGRDILLRSYRNKVLMGISAI